MEIDELLAAMVANGELSQKEADGCGKSYHDMMKLRKEFREQKLLDKVKGIQELQQSANAIASAKKDTIASPSDNEGGASAP